MIHWEDGLFLTRPRLAIDVRRRQPRAFVSHAHGDHIARHEAAYCTPETALLYQHRLGDRRRVIPLPYGEPRCYGDVQLTTTPAGHCLGSAMLLVEGGEKSLLYTGDFKLGRSATAEEADPPRADVLVMECTFGRPKFRLPPRDQVVEQLIALVRSTLQQGGTPVVHAYPLGKGQEVTRLLTAAGISVLQHPAIFAISEIYCSCGVDLGEFQAYDATLLDGRAVVTIPKGFGNFRLPGMTRVVSIAVTGWAQEPATKFRWKVDHALPLSDHADFDELMETARRVEAREIYCTHGPREFVEHLLSHGFHARPVEGPYQRRMF